MWVPKHRTSATPKGTLSLRDRDLHVRLFLLVAISAGAVLFTPVRTAAADSPGIDSKSFFSCDRDRETVGDPFTAAANSDLYHGLFYLAGSAAINFGVNPTQRWSRTNEFDTGLRNGFRLNSPSARKDADLASDFALVFSSALLPVATIGAKFSRTHDCQETWAMFTNAIESMGLTLFITQSVKFASGRARPFAEECDLSPPSDAECGKNSRQLSFFSGHASLAAAGAGLTCSYSLRRDAWGSSRAARLTPCALGAAFALTTGTLRMAADKHWGSDVLLGFAVGALVGYFETWGPLDLLKFSTRDSTGKISSRGMVLPSATQGSLGAQVLLVF